jgi:hypothetical protein
MTAAVETYILYKGLTDLPLKNFIECAVDGNLNALVIEGDAPPEIVNAFWNDIQQSYSELLGGAEAKLSLNLYKEIHRLDATLKQVYSLVEMMVHYYVKEFADILNGLLSTNFSFNVEDAEAYNKDLEMCINHSKLLEVKIKMKSAAWDTIQKTASGGEKVTHEYFIEILIALGNHKNIALDDSISTYAFCHRIKLLNKEFASQQKRK